MRESDVASVAEFRLGGDRVTDKLTDNQTHRKNNVAIAHPYHGGSDIERLVEFRPVV